MALWYRATDERLRKSRPAEPLVAKAGTKWHLVDPGRSVADRLYAACDRSQSGWISEKRDEALVEEATKTRPGFMIPTPGRGATCANCLRLAVRAAGLA